MCVRPMPIVIAAAVAFLGGCERGAGDRPIVGVGTVELHEADIAPLTAGRVTSVRVEEGDRVLAGDTLATLTLRAVAADVDARRAAVQTAEAVLRDLREGARPAELDRLGAELRSLEADASRAERDAQRMESLVAAGSVSRQEYDAARAQARATRARADAAAESLRLLRQGARRQQLAAAEAEVERARAALRAAEGTADELVLLAPAAGVVLVRHVEVGEILAAGEPAFTLADPARQWMRIYLSQAQLPLVNVGDRVVARLDAFPRREFEGRVVSLATRAEFTPRIALTEGERADLLFAVRIELRDTTGMLKAGLPATVTVMPPAPPEHAQRNGDP